MTTEDPKPPADDTKPAARTAKPKQGDVVQLDGGEYAIVVGDGEVVRLGAAERHELPHTRKVG